MKQMKRLAAGFLAAVMLSTTVGAAPAETDGVAANALAGTNAVRYGSQSAEQALAVDLNATQTLTQQTEQGSAFADPLPMSPVAEQMLQQFAVEDLEFAEAADGIETTIAKEQIRLPEPGTYVEGRLVVKMERSLSLQDAENDLFSDLAEDVEFLCPSYEGDDIALMSEDSGADWYGLELREDVSMLSAWKQLLRDDRVLCVEPSYLVKADSAEKIPEQDPYLMSQWHHETIGSYPVWELLENNPGMKKRDVVIAVVDTGVDLDHPDLQDGLLQGYDFVDNDYLPDDEVGHGTHVAGIAAAQRNSVGVRGVAYDAKILPVRVLDAQGGGTSETVAKGIRWAAGDHVNGVDMTAGADVLNISTGAYGLSQLQMEAVEYARSQGCFVVASAGNDALPNAYVGDSYYGEINYPANQPGVFTVMASQQSPDENGNWLAPYSNYDGNPGEDLEYELMAPGSNIYSTAMGGGYCYMDGTSMATPMVAGAAALLMSMGADADTVWDILISATTQKQGRTQPNGVVRKYGELNLEAAVEMLQRGGIAGKKTPRLTNPDVRVVQKPVNIGYGQVDIESTFGTSGVIYYYNNRPIFDLEVELTNLGGSGTSVVSGTIGGALLRGTSVTTAPNETVTVPLQLRSGTIEIINGVVPVEIYVNNERLVQYDLTPFELIPMSELSGISVTGGSNPTGRVTSQLSLHGKTDRAVVYVQDIDLQVSSDLGLYFYTDVNEHFIYHYQCSGKKITLTEDRTSANPEMAYQSVTLLSDGPFQITGTGKVQIAFCQVWEPRIDGITYLMHSKILGRTETCRVTAQQIISSGFVGMAGTVTCDRVGYSMFNKCANLTMTVSQLALYCTFLENYDHEDATSPMRLIVPDFSATTATGMTTVQIVGPMKITNSAGREAVIDMAYIQKACDDRIKYAPLPTFDTVYSNYTDNPNNWGYSNAGLPLCVFAEKGESSGYLHGVSFIENGKALAYDLAFLFASPVSQNSPISLTSDTNAMADYAKCTLSGENVISAQSCSLFKGGEEQYDIFSLSGPVGSAYEATTGKMIDGNLYWPYATRIDSQTFCVRTKIYHKWIRESGSRIVNGNAVLTWSDERIDSDDQAVIYRSVDDGPMEQIRSLKASVGTFTDTNVQPGHVYLYEIAVNEGQYYCSIVCVYETEESGTVKNNVQADGTMKVDLAAVTYIRGEGLEYTYPKQSAKSITFSEEVKNSGLGYGARDNGDGTVTVYIGSAGEQSVLFAGTLFTLTPYERIAKIRVGEAEGVVGDIISVPVYMEDNPGIAGLALVVTYDHWKLALDSIERGDVLSEGNFSARTSTGLVQWYDVVNATEDGVLFTLNFVIQPGAELGEIAIGISLWGDDEGNLVDEEGENVLAEFASGSLVVLKSATENVIDEVTATDGKAVAKVSCVSAGMKIICAGYNGDGKMMTVDMVRGQRGQRTYEFRWDKEGVAYVKVFVLEDNAPACESYTEYVG